MKKNILICMGLIALVFLSGCATAIEDVKTEENLGEKVTVSGTVSGVIKIGDLSGYTLTDKNGDEISIASERLPAEGDSLRVSGVLNRGILIGYYIDVDEE